MNQQGRAKLLEDGVGFEGSLGGIRRNPDVQRLALSNDVIECTHGFFQGSRVIKVVMVKDVHVIETHTSQALIETCDQIFA